MAVADQAHEGAAGTSPARPETILRHSATVRITHWVNVIALTLLLASGLRIFNYHPALYWGNDGYFGKPPFLDIGSGFNADREIEGYAMLVGHSFITTGVLGVSRRLDGSLARQAIPTWLTLPGEPGLALSRDWHFSLAWIFVINGAVYLLSGVLSGHFRRDVLPSSDQMRPRHLLADLWDHVRLRRPRGAAARRYNVLQKFAYMAVAFVLLPLMVLTGLAMSPAVTAAMPFLMDAFGGRQSARTLHFLVTDLIVLFVLVHVVEVFVAGAFNEMRSMITGRFVVRPERPQGANR